MPWFNRKRRAILVVVAAVMFAGAVVGVIWGITHHSEGNRLKVCWSGDAAYYLKGEAERFEVKNGGCKEPEEIIWEKKQIPLTVQVFTSEDKLSTDHEDLQITKAIIKDYNAQVGFEFYRLVKHGPPMVRFYPNAAYTPKSSDNARHPASVPGWAAHSKRPVTGNLRCSAHVRGGLSIRYAYRVGFHEFGHCAGLAHDPDNRASVMFPLTADDTTSEKMLPTRLTDNDVELHQIYR